MQYERTVNLYIAFSHVPTVFLLEQRLVFFPAPCFFSSPSFVCLFTSDVCSVHHYPD